MGIEHARAVTSMAFYKTRTVLTARAVTSMAFYKTRTVLTHLLILRWLSRLSRVVPLVWI